MAGHDKVLITVPAHNEAQSIDAVIDDIRTHAPEADLVVVNDGSFGATASMAALISVWYYHWATQLRTL